MNTEEDSRKKTDIVKSESDFALYDSENYIQPLSSRCHDLT